MAFRSSNSASSSLGVTSIDVTAPSGVATGDVCVCAATNDNTAGAITLPSGATALASSPKTSTADNATTACGTKIETGTPPATYTFGSIGSTACAAVVAAYSGIDTGAAVNASNGGSSSTAASPPIPVIAPSMTTTAACDQVWVGAADAQSSGTQTYTPLTNYTEREDAWSGDFPSISLADWANQDANTTGTVTGTCSVSANGGYMAFLIGLKLAPILVWYDHEGCAPWSSVWRTGRV